MDRTDRQLIIAEGAFDAMSFDVKGYRVLSGISGLKNEQKKIVRGYTEQERKSERDIYIFVSITTTLGKTFLNV